MPVHGVHGTYGAHAFRRSRRPVSPIVTSTMSPIARTIDGKSAWPCSRGSKAGSSRFIMCHTPPLLTHGSPRVSASSRTARQSSSAAGSVSDMGCAAGCGSAPVAMASASSAAAAAAAVAIRLS